METLNKYTFVITTEGIGASEEIVDTEITFEDFTPHEAWKTVGAMIARLEENDSAILSIRLK